MLPLPNGELLYTAVRDIAAGEPLLLEDSVYSRPNLEPPGTPFVILEAQKKTVRERFGIAEEDMNISLFKELFETNAINFCNIKELYLQISRIPHACNANAEYQPHYTLNKGMLNAIKDIRANEVITRNYLGASAAASYAERQHSLSTKFGTQYKCPCAWCSGDTIHENYLQVLSEYLNLANQDQEKPHEPKSILQFQAQIDTWKAMGMRGGPLRDL
jgi:hypothetical protein